MNVSSIVPELMTWGNVVWLVVGLLLGAFWGWGFTRIREAEQHNRQLRKLGDRIGAPPSDRPPTSLGGKGRFRRKAPPLIQVERVRRRFDMEDRR